MYYILLYICKYLVYASININTNFKKQLFTLPKKNNKILSVYNILYINKIFLKIEHLNFALYMF